MRDVLHVTTRWARCVLFMRGLQILLARRAPVYHRGTWIRVVD